MSGQRTQRKRRAVLSAYSATLEGLGLRAALYCLHIRLHVPSELKMNKIQLKTSPNPPNKEKEQRYLQRTCSYGWFCYGVLLSPRCTVQLLSLIHI